MSVAITNTETKIGQRTLGVYRASQIYRGPAEPGPRSAGSVAHRLSGMGVMDVPVSQIVRYRPPIVQAVEQSSLNPDGTASQAPTGVAISPNSTLNTQAVATVQNPSVIPTSVAQIAPAQSPGYVVISSGGGTVANPSPDYFAEIETWLTQQSLISGVPNWGVALAAALVLGFAWKSSAHR